MTPWHGNAFCIIGLLWRESRDDLWIPLRRVNNVVLWCFFVACLNELLNKRLSCRWIELRLHDAYDTSLQGICADSFLYTMRHEEHGVSNVQKYIEAREDIHVYAWVNLVTIGSCNVLARNRRKVINWNRLTYQFGCDSLFHKSIQENILQILLMSRFLEWKFINIVSVCVYIYLQIDSI